MNQPNNMNLQLAKFRDQLQVDNHTPWAAGIHALQLILIPVVKCQELVAISNI